MWFLLRFLGFALVSSLYTSCVLRGALRFFLIIFLLIKRIFCFFPFSIGLFRTVLLL
jgi:hypothetical protein